MGAAVHELFDIVWSIAWKHMSVLTHACTHARTRTHTHALQRRSIIQALITPAFSHKRNYASFTQTKGKVEHLCRGVCVCVCVWLGEGGYLTDDNHVLPEKTSHSTSFLETKRLDAACRDKGEFVSRTVSFHWHDGDEFHFRCCSVSPESELHYSEFKSVQTVE